MSRMGGLATGPLGQRGQRARAGFAVFAVAAIGCAVAASSASADVYAIVDTNGATISGYQSDGTTPVIGAPSIRFFEQATVQPPAPWNEDDLVQVGTGYSLQNPLGESFEMQTNNASPMCEMPPYPLVEGPVVHGIPCFSTGFNPAIYTVPGGGTISGRAVASGTGVDAAGNDYVFDHWDIPAGFSCAEGSTSPQCTIYWLTNGTAPGLEYPSWTAVYKEVTGPALKIWHTPDGQNGWNVSAPVTEWVSASDAGSSLQNGEPACTIDGNPVTLTPNDGEQYTTVAPDEPTPAPTWTFPVSGDGTHSISCTATDDAANQSIATDTVYLDTQPPVVTVQGVTNGGVYTLGAVPTASCSTTDPGAPATGSGVATQASLSLTGGTANGVGQFTATCTGATDVAGNQGSVATATYTVNYASSGFLAPIDNSPTVNTGKAGRTYPVKFQLTDANGNYISALTAVSGITFQQAGCGSFQSDPTDPLETTATGGTSLRYDSTANQYVYNWQTPSASGCYVLNMALDSGQTLSAWFQLK